MVWKEGGKQRKPKQNGENGLDMNPIYKNIRARARALGGSLCAAFCQAGPRKDQNSGTRAKLSELDRMLIWVKLLGTRVPGQCLCAKGERGKLEIYGCKDVGPTSLLPNLKR